MTFKCTWLWNGNARNGGLSFGFSESWYTDDSPAILLPKMQDLAFVRAEILAKDSILYGYRVQSTNPGTRAFTQYPGAVVKSNRNAGTPNVPQDAALCVCYGTVAGTVKRFWLHNLPDGAVEDADFADNQIKLVARRFIQGLAAGGFKFRYINPAAASAPIGSITNLGVVNLLEPLVGAAAGKVIQLNHVRGVDDRGKRGKFAIGTFVDNQNFTLLHWDGGVVGMSGRMRLLEYLYTSISSPPDQGLGNNPTIRPGTRKCGRPFGAPRGRAVARR